MTVLTDDLEETILQSIRKGAPQNTACEAAGISPSTLSRWLQIAEGAETWSGSTVPVDEHTKARIARFAERLRRARADTRRAVIGSLYYNATTKNEKTGWYDTQAADKLLSKSADHREEWHEDKHLTVTQQGTVSHEHRAVEAMTEHEVLAAAGDDWAELATPPTLPALPAPAVSATAPVSPAQHGLAARGRGGVGRGSLGV